MHTLQKVAVAAAATLLVFLLFSFGFAWSTHQVLGSATGVKKALNGSGIYNSVVGEALDQAQKKQTENPENTSDSQVPVNQPQIRQIIEQAFPPTFLKTQTEGVIDSGYAWINGDTATLAFKIDLADAKLRLADGVGQYVQQHLASLPACTEIPSGDVDPFNATCVPAGFDIPAAAAKARDNILNGDFLKDTTISADTIKNNDGKTLNQQVQNAPKTYQQGVWALYGSGILALGLAAVVVFVSATWRKGLHKLSVIIISVGGISALFGWLSSFTVHRVALKLASNQTADQPLQQQLIRVVQSLADDLRMWWMTFGLTLVVLGIVALVVLHFTKSKDKSAEHPSHPNDGGMIDDKLVDAEAAPAPASKKPPQKPRGKIQL